MTTTQALVRRWSLWVCFFALLVGDRAVQGWGGPDMGIVQPKNYVSRSAEYSIFVDPRDRSGNGAANYRFLRNGEVVWSGEKPYTLREVTVTDDGHVAGFAYRTGPDSIPMEHRSERYMHVVILDRSGKELLNDVSPRQLVHMHGPTLPLVEDILLDPLNDRLIACVHAREFQWWVFRISTGTEVARLDVQDPAVAAGKVARLADTRLIPETSLLLTQWYLHDREYQSKQIDGLFVLFDANLRPVWRWDAPNDYTSLNLFRGEGSDPSGYFVEHPAILRADEPRRFDVRLFSESKRVSFAVAQTTEVDYEVHELGRVVFGEDATATAAPESPAKPLSYLGELRFGSTAATESPFREIWDFTFDAQNQIHFLRKQKQPPNILVTVDQAGEVKGERSLVDPPQGLMARHWLETPRLKDDSYIEIRKTGEDAYSALLIQLRTGEERLLEHYPGGYARSISRFGDGRFVILDSYSQRSSPADRLRYFDAEGNQRWELRSDKGNDYDILGIRPTEVVVTSEQRIVLLNIDSLQILDREGKLIKKIGLTGAFGNTEFSGRPGYLNQVVADAEGGFIIANHRNPPVVLRYARDGTLRSHWTPRHPDGKTFDLRPQIRVAPDGRMWTGDGTSIMRLTDDGVVDLVLGAVPDSDRLDQVAAFTTDFEGRMYAAARGTGAVHVFDQEGKRLHVRKPDPTDLAGTVTGTFVAVNDKGEVYLKKPATQMFMPPDTYLRFSASGERMDSITFEPSIPVSPFLPSGWAFQPKTNHRCGICGVAGDDRLVIVDPPNKLIREVRKRPDGRWFGGINELAMGPDGSMVVLDADWSSKPLIYELDLFAVNGDPVRTIPLPTAVKRFKGIGFDGRRAVVAGNEEVLIVDTQTNKVDRHALTAPGIAEQSWSVHILPSGDELLLFDRSTGKIHRYQLPPIVTESEPKTDRAMQVVPDVPTLVVSWPWIVEYGEVASALSNSSTCTIYSQRTGNGIRYLTPERVALLPETEREGLQAYDMSNCGIRFDAPAIFGRMLDILAANGLTGVTDRRFLDFSCCELRHLQALARLGANATYLEAGFDLTSYCNNWADVGHIAGFDGQQGQLAVIRAGSMGPGDAPAKLGGRYDVITVRNVLHKLAADDYSSVEPWANLGIAMRKEEVVTQLFDLLVPGGLLLVYNVGVEPTPAENTFSPGAWKAAGFKVIAFDCDDRSAALGIGLELGWDAKSSPLEKTIRAKYTLLTRPKE